MNNRNRIELVVLGHVLAFALNSCSTVFDPFLGQWQSGARELSFYKGKEFKLSIGDGISVNLKGTYAYDKDTLTLHIAEAGSVKFTYRFGEGEKLILVPKTVFEYIKTQIVFNKLN